MPGKFVVKKGPTGKFRFNLVSTNGQIVATSEAYETKASAMNGIRAVKSLAAAALLEDQTAPAPKGAAATKAAGTTKKATPPAREPAGGACGYYTEVGLFGGPPQRRGCGQTEPPGSEASSSPSVELPAAGSPTAVAVTDADGAIAQYGPAVVFGGKSPAGGDTIPRSGAMTVSTKGTATVTSSASVKNVAAGPFTADSVKSTATASKAGAKGSATISKGVVVTAVDADGNPKTTKAVPNKPEPNLSFKGKNAIGDKFKLVVNEQKKGKDGSITVVGVHVYLLGPTAVGDVVVAESLAR
jgi:uncharacterized protein YegP (UPF0339 family)